MASNPPTPLGASNPRLKALRRLSGRRSARSEAGLVVVEGAGLVGEALDAGLAVAALYVRDDATDDPEVQALATRVEVAGGEVSAVAARAFDGLASTVSPQPVLAEVVWRPAPLDEVAARATGETTGAPTEPALWFVLAGVADPGNAGAVVRVAEAAGVEGVVACGGVDLTNPKVVRAAAGALFRLRVVAGPDDAAEAVAVLRERGIGIVTTVAAGGVSHDELDWTRPWAVVLGNEARGVPEALHRQATPVTIAMAGRVESLNVATAAAVLAFEARRQRRRATGPRPA